MPQYASLDYQAECSITKQQISVLQYFRFEPGERHGLIYVYKLAIFQGVLFLCRESELV